jgi:hypothetical protein
MRRLLVTASVVPSSPICVTLMKEALRSSETSVLTRATWRNIPEDAILHRNNYVTFEVFNGFRKNHLTVDQVHRITDIIEKKV